MFYFYDLKKAGIFGIPNGILQDTGAELFKTHKIQTILGKMEQTEFPKQHTHTHTHTHPAISYQSRP